MLKYFLLFFVLLIPVFILSGKKSKVNQIVTAGRVVGVGSLLLLVVFLVALASLFFGSSDIDSFSIFRWLISGGNETGTGLSDTEETIFIFYSSAPDYFCRHRRRCSGCGRCCISGASAQSSGRSLYSGNFRRCRRRRTYGIDAGNSSAGCFRIGPSWAQSLPSF